MKPWQYRAIAAWGHYLGSQQYYIDAQQALAADQGAPIDALYYRGKEKGWLTVSDLRAEGMRPLADRLTRAVEAADLVEKEKHYDR